MQQGECGAQPLAAFAALCLGPVSPGQQCVQLGLLHQDHLHAHPLLLGRQVGQTHAGAVHQRTHFLHQSVHIGRADQQDLHTGLGGLLGLSAEGAHQFGGGSRTAHQGHRTLQALDTRPFVPFAQIDHVIHNPVIAQIFVEIQQSAEEAQGIACGGHTDGTVAFLDQCEGLQIALHDRCRIGGGDRRNAEGTELLGQILGRHLLTFLARVPALILITGQYAQVAPQVIDGDGVGIAQRRAIHLGQ